jgi:hypothetical protein
MIAAFLLHQLPQNGYCAREYSSEPMVRNKRSNKSPPSPHSIADSKNVHVPVTLITYAEIAHPADYNICYYSYYISFVNSQVDLFGLAQ